MITDIGNHTVRVDGYAAEDVKSTAAL
jgi:hypothetical protein